MPDGADSRSSVSQQPAEPLVAPPVSGSGVPETPYSGVAEIPYVAPSNDKTVISKRSSNIPVAIPAPLKSAEVGVSLVGEMLGHFRLEEFVGGGGMGAVFRATDTMLGRTVAVKVVSNDVADEEMLRRFRNEAQSAARLDHPNIARVYYVGEDKRWNYIVFEFIEGVNVRDLVEHRGALPLGEAISYILQVSEALEHAAQRDVVHRDIKPSNILVMPDGRAKLVDMGLARLHQVDAPSQDLTATGVTLGTFDYISPEQARDPRSADARSDLYSLGCTLYFMLTGMPPFPEGTVLQKLLSHSSDPPPDPRELRADLDDELGAIALKLMAKQPGQRYQTPAELTDALLRLSHRLGLPHERYVQAMTLVPATGFSRLLHHVPWIVPLILLLVVIFVGEMILPQSSSVSHDALRREPMELNPSNLPVAPVKTSGAASATDESRSAADGHAQTNATDPASNAPASPTRQGAAPVSSAKEISSGTPANLTASSSASQAASPEASKPGSGGTSSPGEQTRSSVTPQPSSATITNTTNRDPIDQNLVDVNRGTTEGTLTTSNATPKATAAPRDPHVIIVSPNETLSNDPQTTTSLEAAIRLAESLPEVDTIELRFDRRTETSLRLSARDENSELTIRAGEGFSPLIQFRPSSGDMLVDHSMLRLVGGKVNFVGVHFRLELLEPLVNEWSLFHLKRVKNVSFRNCTFTVHNDYQATASFFFVEGAPLSRMMPEGMPSTSPPLTPTISLNSCIARGQANLVRAVEGLPFRLSWEQGFLATTEPAVFARGLKDTSGAQLIDLALNRITASIPNKLCLVEVDNNAPFVPSLKVDCNQCVFDVRNENTPLVEHRGVENLESLMRNLYIQRGASNLYSQSLQILWRIQSRDGDEREFGWRPEADWYQERSSEKYTPWRSPLPGPGKLVHAYSASDFLLIREQASMAGFDESQLPLPPEPTPEPVSPAGTTNSDD